MQPWLAPPDSTPIVGGRAAAVAGRELALLEVELDQIAQQPPIAVAQLGQQLAAIGQERAQLVLDVGERDVADVVAESREQRGKCRAAIG